MYQEKTGVNAGNVWNALNVNGAMTGKDLKKAAKLKNDKELYLALGWLLREDKVEIAEEAKEIKVTLK
ncbi:MAG: winged helix-turn-helix domain-containing protein [Bacteroidaceae bacterium]|nr:winged helix-turn-helix domain-containing protein [Bacteroidaceae bacterium]